MTVADVRKAKVRRDLVEPYAAAVRAQCFYRPAEKPKVPAEGWPAINEAIAAKWSWSAVSWVKREAWKQAQS